MHIVGQWGPHAKEELDLPRQAGGRLRFETPGSSDDSVELQILKQFLFEFANLASLRKELSALVERLLQPRKIDRLHR